MQKVTACCMYVYNAKERVNGFLQGAEMCSGTVACVLLLGCSCSYCSVEGTLDQCQPHPLYNTRHVLKMEICANACIVFSLFRALLKLIVENVKCTNHLYIMVNVFGVCLSLSLCASPK